MKSSIHNRSDSVFLSLLCCFVLVACGQPSFSRRPKLDHGYTIERSGGVIRNRPSSLSSEINKDQVILRQEGDLIIPVNKQKPGKMAGRVGSNRRHSKRWPGKLEWVGPKVPPYVPLMYEGSRLTILDVSRDGHLAFYRESDNYVCGAKKRRSCKNYVRMTSFDGSIKWSVDLNHDMTGNDIFQVQDVRYEDGTLYFNEVCPAAIKGETCLTELIERGGFCALFPKTL